MIKNVHSTNQNTQIVTILQTVYIIFLPLIISAILMARPLVTAKNHSQGQKTTEQRAKNSKSQSVSFTEKRKSQTEPRRTTKFSNKKISNDKKFTRNQPHYSEDE